MRPYKLNMTLTLDLQNCVSKLFFFCDATTLLWLSTDNQNFQGPHLYAFIILVNGNNDEISSQAFVFQHIAYYLCVMTVVSFLVYSNFFNYRLAYYNIILEPYCEIYLFASLSLPCYSGSTKIWSNL